MPDLRDRFRDLDALDVPDVLERAHSIGPRPPAPEPAPSIGRRIAVAALALLVGLAGVFLASRFTRDPDRAPASTVPCPAGAWLRPNVSPVAGEAREVAAPSPDDLWTFAWGRGPDGGVSSLRGRLLHLTEGGWRESELPPGRVDDMAVSSSGEVWVLTERAAWRRSGASWTRLPLPERLSMARVILPLGSDDVWITGDTAGPRVSHVWHWEGASWSDVALPAVASSAYITAMAGTGPDDIWVTAWGDDAVRPLHWDGSTWTAHPALPIHGGDSVKFLANARDDVWLLAGPRLVHWNGAAWTPTRDPSLSDNRLSDVASGPSGTWLVDGARGTLLRWDGARWVPAITPPERSYLSASGGAEGIRLAVMGHEVAVVHGPYVWTRRNPDGSGTMSAGPITAFIYACGSG